MEFSYTKGQRLLVELINNQIFEGDCEKCTKDRLDMVNVREHPNGEKLKDLLSYYRSEIASVHVLNQENDDEVKGTPINGSQLNETTQPHSSGKVIALPIDEYNRLKDMTEKYIYFATIDNRYLTAVNYLLNCESVGVVGIGSEVGRIKTISLLVLASWDQVYIFDLLLYRKTEFPLDLKAILETKRIKKVVHNSQVLNDCLWHCHKIKLNNFFDTCVTDVLLEKEQIGCLPEKTRNLSECLVHYLNFPSTFLDQAMDVSLEEWEERPLDNSRKVKASQLVVYLITLKLEQEAMLLKKVNNAFIVYSLTMVNADGYTARKYLSSNNIPEEIRKYL